jgi:tripartite-type tricarboxylate transporter receptor subunit TctC
MVIKAIILVSHAFALAILLTAHAAAQNYSAKPVRLIVAQAAGGASDILIRPIAQKLSESLGQQFVIDNKPGAGANIGAEIAAKSPSDGYTLFMVSGPHAVAPSLYPKLSYDLMRDFAPITMLGVEQLCLVVHPSLPVKTVKEFTAFLKAHPGAVSYGSSGNGSVNHLAMEMFQSIGGVRLIHIPYKGSAFALPDAINGRVPVLFGNLSPLQPHILSGRLRPLGVTSSRRSPALPDVPTIAESGYPTYNATNWYGIVAPAGVADDIVRKLNAAIIEAVNSPPMREQYSHHGVDPMTTTPDEMRSFLRSEIDKWARVVKSSGARVE